MKIDVVIGIVGGMGSYATVDFFKRIIDAFPAEKEWERPRIIIDNRCTMPSRVRALLYNERREELVDELCNSIRLLINGGATDIVLACNTSHCFLDDIFMKHPEYKKYIINIIEQCSLSLKNANINQAYLIATEGTIQTKIYSEYFERHNIKAILPTEDDLKTIRSFIESVKQNKITTTIKNKFIDFIDSISCDAVVLGCTEIPVLYSTVDYCGTKIVVDPLSCVIDLLKNKLNQ